jgi:hypothetical protein
MDITSSLARRNLRAKWRSFALPSVPCCDRISAAGDVLTTSELARRQNTAPSTVCRWIDKRLPDGRGGRVFLEAVRRGKTWLTSSAAVRRFFERLEHSSPPLACEKRNTFAKTGQPATEFASRLSVTQAARPTTIGQQLGASGLGDSPG